MAEQLSLKLSKKFRSLIIMKICKFGYLCGLLPACINLVNKGQKGHNILAKKYRNIHVCYFPKDFASQSEMSSNAEFM